MWPLDRPAKDVLKLPGETDVLWAVFDIDWYFRSYPEVAGLVAADNPPTALQYYLEVGQTRGHSPNRMFDDAWHRRMYPQIAEAVQAGHYLSAFDAYCRRGALDRSAHWLFDELGYRARYPDLSNDVLSELGSVNGYDHYLRHGITEDRIGHPLFDTNMYLSHFGPAEVGAIRRSGVLQHYLNYIESGQPELRTSIYFDPQWYLRQYPQVAADIAAGQWKCALHHYLCSDKPTAFDPSDDFSEAWYLRRDPGLSDVIRSGHFRNGYMHFLQFGANELRSPSSHIDLTWYVDQQTVRASLQTGAFDHWLRIGKPAGLASTQPPAAEITALQAQRLQLRFADALLPVAGRTGFDFTCTGAPSISVVMAVRDGFAAAMATVASLRSNTTARIELVLVDCGSRDETRFIGSYVRGATLLRFDSDIGWSRAADAGRQAATGQSILFLAAGAQIAPGAVDRAQARLASDASVGAVGGLILRPDGMVAQAGGILCSDGRVHHYQSGASPLAPETGFVRDTDFCAADFLMVRASLLSDLDGFDYDCSQGFDAVDLCLRLRQAGFGTVYDPSVMIIGDAGPAQSGDCGDHFRRKHAARLVRHLSSEVPVHVLARHTSATPHRVLFIEDTVPVRRLGSGFVRANDLVNMMASLGFAVTVFPVNGCDQPISRVFGDLADTVEVMHTLSLDDFAAFLKERPGYYDTIWIARTHNLAKVRPVLIADFALRASPTLQVNIVLDTEAVTPEREAIQAGLAGKPYDLAGAMTAIQIDAEICHRVVAVTAAEADTLRRHGLQNVSVIGHMIEPNPTARSFAQRAGLLFVGAIHTADSPNLDSLIWFVDAVLPLIEAELKWETRLTVAGYVAPGIDLSRLEQHPRITLRGPVADLTPLYNAHRIFVAPTRYAAGAPYKVLEAASHGLPAVATELLRTELGWLAEQEIISAPTNDSEAFAACILDVYRNEIRWQALRDGALRRLQQDNGRENYLSAVASVLRHDPDDPLHVVSARAASA
jgi:GT2 family glycosyltransferase